MPREDVQRLHVFVRGQVQGVGFRHFTMRTAGNLGLQGWVRNLRDGRVEIVAEGKRSRLEELLQDVKRGPVSARVEGVQEEWRKAQNDFTGFKVRRTV